MTATSRAHIALADEPIPAPGPRQFKEPDMRAVAPIEQMTSWLNAVADDDVAYNKLWLNLINSIGCTVGVHYHRDAGVSLMTGGPVDIQTRHRSRWLDALVDHLDDIPGRRDCLYKHLRRSRLVIDERPIRRRETTAAVRGYLKVGGRIMIHPNGDIEEGGADSAVVIGHPQANQILSATRQYFDVRQRLQTDRQLRRIVRRLGKPVNGWLVLGGKPLPQEVSPASAGRGSTA